jgi:hypothetical protein
MIWILPKVINKALFCFPRTLWNWSRFWNANQILNGFYCQSFAQLMSWHLWDLTSLLWRLFFSVIQFSLVITNYQMWLKDVINCILYHNIQQRHISLQKQNERHKHNLLFPSLTFAATSFMPFVFCLLSLMVMKRLHTEEGAKPWHATNMTAFAEWGISFTSTLTGTTEKKMKNLFNKKLELPKDKKILQLLAALLSIIGIT